MLQLARLRSRAVVATGIQQVIEFVLPGDPLEDRRPPPRGASVDTRILQLLHLVRGRRDSRALADRCRVSRFRLWAYGYEVNVDRDTGDHRRRLVEFSTGHVIAFDLIGAPSARSARVVPTDAERPVLVLR